ncbi:MAG: M23 family metallopeptidase [Baekduia sp.]
MSRLMLVVVLGAGLFALDVGAAAAAPRWRMPLARATVVGPFSFERAAPYASGWRRGIDLLGVPGARVVAACAGIVTYAGRVPGWGRGVSLRCGSLVATELGLASASVARGARLWPGATLGRLGPRGLLRLGARRAGVRQGYVDPLGLLHRGERPAPPVAPVAGRRVVAGDVIPHPSAVASPHEAALSWPAWAGLALLAAAVGGGGTSRRRRRGRRRTGMALAQR